MPDFVSTPYSFKIFRVITSFASENLATYVPGESFERLSVKSGALVWGRSINQNDKSVTSMELEHTYFNSEQNCHKGTKFIYITSNHNTKSKV